MLWKWDQKTDLKGLKNFFTLNQNKAVTAVNFFKEFVQISIVANKKYGAVNERLVFGLLWVAYNVTEADKYELYSVSKCFHN